MKGHVMKNDFEIIGMCHLMALPGDKNYNRNIDETIERAKYEINILQNNGFSKILFSNEYSYPYTDKVDETTSMAMAYIIGTLKQFINVPFGVDCMYDSFATINLAIASSADFYRLTVSHINTDNMLLGKADINKLIRYANTLSTYGDSKLYLNISTAIKSIYSSDEKKELLKLIDTQISPYAICVASNDAYKDLSKTNDISTKIICDGGCNSTNIKEISQLTNGAIIGTSLKRKGRLQNSIDEERVKTIVSLINNS